MSVKKTVTLRSTGQDKYGSRVYLQEFFKADPETGECEPPTLGKQIVKNAIDAMILEARQAPKPHLEPSHETQQDEKTEQ